MNIDRILSRFKIQTKVLIFILPFVISISAVGLTGLYTSDLLEGRMEISNSVLQSLSGFRDVSSSMSAFLEDTNQETRAKVSDELKQQRAILDETLGQLPKGAQGREDLEKVLTSVDAVASKIDTLWELDEKETAIRTAITDNLALVTDAQKKIITAATRVQVNVRVDENSAKTLLSQADQINATSAFLTDIAKKFSTQPSPEAKYDFAKANFDEIKKRTGKLKSVLPEKSKSISKTIEANLAALTGILDRNDKSDATVSELSAKINAMRQTSVYLGLAAGQRMKEASDKFAELKQPLIKAERLLTGSRKVVEDAYAIRINLATFMLEPNEKNRGILARDLGEMSAHLKTLVFTAEEVKAISETATKLVPVIDAMGAAAKELVSVSEQRFEKFSAAGAEIDTIWQQLTTFAELQKQSAGAEREDANSISLSAMAAGIIIAIFAGIGLVMTFKGPIGQITAAMRRLADGALDTSISGEARVDEIGEMARALGVFKQNALSKIEIEQRSEAERRAAEEERQRNDREKVDVDRQIDFAVDALAAGLGRLSQGDISETIETPFFGRLEQLRNDFNVSLLRLQDTMSQIRGNASMIQRNTVELSDSADELSKRTEQQAASLEETAAAVDQITATVNTASERAAEARTVVAQAKRNADNSAAVVQNAISAMSRIKDSSDRIAQIIDVIDSIAFQTNLLALNAGVEAARAGEAGKGFAVVAQEVRELAQRSAKAAKEIGELIATSVTEVSTGSQYVAETGSVLTEISRQIVDVAGHVELIATSAREQAASLSEVNSTVNQMDQVTQRNAAMVEETNAATRQLAEEADTLMQLVAAFSIERENGNHRRHAA
ncbi:methyl-accepting chemotaxis protein [Rhizobium alvei]|uniref:HAMP domain-containing methyl-accepting chemotaxis protein n=1 Tax=Rhizobium alvei TaxID=1132659 RepID=A0ABT8YGY9_9HYPH|nr:HAMP domain-containing methyl-accepting chemotaxis protein [Rhizobium alvei]MDO6962603.1 HAMP domain-containing methyl-accepting chemotaxis protein [Rhizobium alvei]